MEKTPQIEVLMAEWRETKAAADAIFLRHLAPGADLQGATDARGKPFTLKTLKQIKKARKAERRAWDVLDGYLLAKLAQEN